ncbi:hypothetical protein CcaverHIS002_0201580 [Cutaneotrichosporon cavernicola]|nr:hypothetical protein CcaverHIS002_0201580 [Cutaneotrichosporon cavernicola]BEI96574.1 hypothetical protein CcaverHIS631_0201630 [Cutaneotrichosporon cavernicola]
MSTASSAVLSNVANLDKTIVVLGVFAFLGKRVAEYFDKSLGWSVVGILTERDDTPSNMSSRICVEPHKFPDDGKAHMGRL